MRAFTLIELLIVIAIMGILATLVVAPLGSGRIERELEAEARELVGVMREAQNYALTGKQGLTNTDPCRFQVSWGGTSYTLTYWYKDGTGACTQTSIVRTHPLKSGVAFSSVDSVSFTLPYADTGIGPGSKAVVFSKQSSVHVACVYADGRITDQPGSTCL